MGFITPESFLQQNISRLRYCIPRIFLRHVYFTVKHEVRNFAVEILRMKVIQKFLGFLHLATRLCMKMYATNLSEIDQTPYQIVYHN